MTSLLFLIETISYNIFRCNYLKEKIFFSIFVCLLRNRDSILNISEEKMTLIADVFLNLRNPKNVGR